MPASNIREQLQILIASDDSALRKHYTDVLGDQFTLLVTDSVTEAQLLLTQQLPQIVIIDPLLFKDSINSTITDIATTSPLSRIIVIEDKTDRLLDQMELFRTGAHGFFADNITPSLLGKAVHSVSTGEVWVPRKLISTLISELASKTAANMNRQKTATKKSMSRLTPRELEVAQMVHSGGNNKMIARELAISERTVKAHLSAIFRKLNIENRLHLALFFNQAI